MLFSPVVIPINELKLEHSERRLLELKKKSIALIDTYIYKKLLVFQAPGISPVFKTSEKVL